MKEFNLILTPGLENNDKIVVDFIREKYGEEMPWIFYSLPYVPPYQENWEGIINYERVCQYHPFLDESQEKTIVIDLKEWVSEDRIHEDFLNIFFMYLHDQHSYFDLKYVFTVGAYKEKDVRELIMLLYQYFEKGCIKINRVFQDIGELEKYITKKHKHISKELVARMAGIIIEGKEKIGGISQLDSLLEGIENSVSGIRERIDEKLLIQRAEAVRTTGFYMLYEREMEKILGEHEKNSEECKNSIRKGRIA
mgnify:FL=1